MDVQSRYSGDCEKIVMPTTSTRGRRQGRPRNGGGPTSAIPTTHSKTLPEEGESLQQPQQQQQQSSNKMTSVPSTSVKTEERRGTVSAPSKRAIKGKRKNSVNGKRATDCIAEDTVCSSAAMSMQETEGEQSMSKGKKGGQRGQKRKIKGKKMSRVHDEKLQDDGLLGERSQNQIEEKESEGENRVSDSEACPLESQTLVKDPIVKEQYYGDFPFDVFVDDNRIQRASQATFVLPICVGSIAFWQGKRAPDTKCYKWAVYVRSPGKADLSHIVKKVRFKLHPSFAQQERVIENPPYELEETGWGEFDVRIHLELHDDVCEGPIKLTHSLKLYTTGEASTKRPVVSETYDEIVFSEPSAHFFERVQNIPDKTAPVSKFETFFQTYDSHLVDDCMQRIQLVRQKIRKEIRELKVKADSYGIHVIFPENFQSSKGVENEPVKDIRPTKLRKKERKPFRSSSKKMRLIIDTENKDKPFRMEPIHPHGVMKAAKEPKGSLEEDTIGLDASLPIETTDPNTVRTKLEPMDIDGKKLKQEFPEIEESESSENETYTKSQAELKHHHHKNPVSQVYQEYYEEVSSSGEGIIPNKDPNPPQLNGTQASKPCNPQHHQVEMKEGLPSEDEAMIDESGSSSEEISDSPNTNDYDVEDDD